MIIGYLLDLFSKVIIWLIGFLPDAGTGLGSGVSDAISSFGTIIHTYDYFFPASFAVQLVVTSLGIEILLWFAYFIMWLIRTIRG